ncbi:serine protease AprX [Vallitalea longa]|uniref:Serine protease AprX n=2 Tax=Vallitalea longa TaxID=2936439 RepID=A0A9W6DFV7_9FIRM|nr:serine protease AprX [Vallitalea longa]
MKNIALFLLPILYQRAIKGKHNYTNNKSSIKKEDRNTDISVIEDKDNHNKAIKNIQVIVNCSKDDKYENELKKLGRVKYRLPMINSYVLELPEKYVGKLNGIKGVEAVEHDALITAQMDVARETVNTTWADVRGVSGKGIGIAVVDTGVYPHQDLTKTKNKIVGFKDFVNNKEFPYDDNGHGTHVAGIISGDGYESNGKYKGIAVESNIIGVKVLNKKGSGNISDVLAGIQWILDNRKRFNIRIINLSVGMKDIEGEKSALVRGVNAAWDSGLIIVTAAGNNGPEEGTITTPGISRKVITVGSSDDAETVKIMEDLISDYSGRGPTKECIKKPDIVAPGSNIIACSTDKEYTPKDKYYPNNDIGYTKKSGTSMATPIVSGCIALLLSRHPELTGKDVKLKLKDSAIDLGFSQAHQGWGLIDVKKLLQ